MTDLEAIISTSLRHWRMADEEPGLETTLCCDLHLHNKRTAAIYFGAKISIWAYDYIPGVKVVAEKYLRREKHAQFTEVEWDSFEKVLQITEVEWDSFEKVLQMMKEMDSL